MTMGRIWAAMAVLSVACGLATGKMDAVAAGDQEAQPGTAKYIDGLGIFPIRLGDNAYAVTGVFQNPADNGVTEGRMVHIGIADDVNKVTAFPAPVQHIFFANG